MTFNFVLLKRHKLDTENFEQLKDMRMVHPERVVEPVVAIILLEHLVVSDLQKLYVLLIYAFIPDVIQDGHLLEVRAPAEVRPGRRGDRRQAAQQDLVPGPPCATSRLRGHHGRLVVIAEEVVFGRQYRLRLHLSFPKVQA